MQIAHTAETATPNPAPFVAGAVYTKKQVATGLGVSERTVERLRIKQIRLGYRTRRFRGEDINRHLEGMRR